MLIQYVGLSGTYMENISFVLLVKRHPFSHFLSFPGKLSGIRQFPQKLS